MNGKDAFRLVLNLAHLRYGDVERDQDVGDANSPANPDGQAFVHPRTPSPVPNVRVPGKIEHMTPWS